MRKIQILGAAFFAVLAFGAIVAASASATDEWLINGNLVGLGEQVHARVLGTWLLLALGFGGISVVHVVCNGVLLGTLNGLNPSGIGTDTITLVENLAGTEKDLIKCKVLHGTGEEELGICSGSLEATVHALHLPWLTKLLLPRSGMATPEDDFSEEGKGKPAFELECTEFLGGKFKETCEANVKTDELKNETNGTILGRLLNQLSEKCNGTGNSAHLYGTGILETLSGLAVTVS
jgi:hypothetical protein